MDPQNIIDGRVTNAEVLRCIGKEREIVNTVKGRKLEYLGQILRGKKYELLQLRILGKIQGKRSIGSWLRNLKLMVAKPKIVVRMHFQTNF
ncbi:hypothetical protein JTB14_036637 [Gonioctena quinquepunctata]|nr:hypothetical protein JTB14_036637 [Gonioctena quinquepunctata]